MVSQAWSGGTMQRAVENVDEADEVEDEVEEAEEVLLLY